MFIVQSAGASPFYCGASAYAATSCQAAYHNENRENEFATKKTSLGLSRSGRLRRTGSNLSDVSQESSYIVCIAEARQIELTFSSFAERPCTIEVRAPSGEESGRLQIKESGESVRFAPIQPGCGHGDWQITVTSTEEMKGGEPIQWTSSLSLEGVGSLFFTIDDSYKARLTSQEFLVLPQQALCSYRQF